MSSHGRLRGEAQEGQDAVAHETCHGAFISDHGLDHVVERLVHNLGPLFGIEMFGERRRTSHVAKQHRDDAAFSLSASTGAG